MTDLETIKNIVQSMLTANEKKTSAYGTEAQVLRVDGDTAWVHIPGGVAETPVKMTLSAKPGDTVQVRVENGGAFIDGNATAPPTDDTTATRAVQDLKATNKIVKAVKSVADKASRIAGNTSQYFWHTQEGTDTGAHITEVPQDEFLADPTNGGGNLLARSNGIAVRDGLTELATFGADGAQIGTSGASHTIIDEDGQRVYGGNGTALIAHLGYGETVGEGGLTYIAPYFTFGGRGTGNIGARSVAEGNLCVASGESAHAEGTWSKATGDWAHAEGFNTIASGRASHSSGTNTEARGRNQTAIGRYNVVDTNGDYAFIIGNGTDYPYTLSNAFAVKWTGEVDVPGGTLTAQSTATTWSAINPYSSRCTIEGGGYFVEGKHVYIEVALKLASAMTAGGTLQICSMAATPVLGKVALAATTDTWAVHGCTLTTTNGAGYFIFKALSNIATTETIYISGHFVTA